MQAQAQQKQRKTKKSSEARAVAAVERRVEKIKRKVDQSRSDAKLGGLRGSEAEKLNREMHRASKVMIPKTPRTSFHAWIHAASKPFEGRNVPCPINYAPAPSLISTTATVTSNFTLTVQANKSTQIGLFPGHCGGAKSTQPLSANGSGGYIPLFPSQMDPTSFHHQVITMSPDGGTTLQGYSVGPLSDQGGTGYGQAVLGGIAENQNPGQASFNSSFWKPIVPDVELPFKMELVTTTNPTQARHVRWRLDSMGIRIVNTTAMIDRGGYIQSCQFSNGDGITAHGSSGQPTIASNEINPTFKLHGKDNVEIAWIPRFADLAFWHTCGPASVAASQTSLSNTNTFQVDDSQLGMAVWLTSGEKTQAYTVQIIQNFSLAGPLINSIGGPAPHMPEAKNIAEHVISTAQNFSASFSEAPKFAARVASALSQGKEYVAQAAAAGTKVLGALGALGQAGFI